MLRLLSLDKGRIPCRGNLYFTQHLTNNDFDMLVIDLDPLQAVDLLNLIDDVLCQCGNTLEAKNIVWTGRPF